MYIQKCFLYFFRRHTNDNYTMLEEKVALFWDLANIRKYEMTLLKCVVGIFRYPAHYCHEFCRQTDLVWDNWCLLGRAVINVFAASWRFVRPYSK